MSAFARQRWMSIGLALVGMLLSAFVLVSGRLVEERLQERWRAESLSELAGLRARLEGQINGATNLTAGLIADVAVSGTIAPARFQLLARELMRTHSLLRNITLAPNNVIEMVYPLEGNQAALGLDLLNHPVQGAATRRMLETRQPVLAGPVDLVQGGRALIHRVPIYLADQGAAPRSGPYWGLMSTPIDFDRLLASAGLVEPEGRLLLALRGVDGSGWKGAVFWGDPVLFDRPDRIELDVRVLDGGWGMVAIPRYPPPGLDAVRGWTRAIALACFAVALVLAWYLDRTGRRLEQSEAQVRQLALHDSLTGLANRVLLEGRYRQAAEVARREGHRLALLYLDLDDFKPVNDQYGHETGDHVLRAVAQRLGGDLRQSDTVARVGGDEFVVLLGRVSSPDDALGVAEKIVERLQQPFVIDGIEFVIGASIGIALQPDHADELSALMRCADQAMYTVKGVAGGKVAIADAAGCDSVKEMASA